MHAPIGLGATGGEEAVRMFAHRALGNLVAQRHSDQRALDVVLVHFFQGVLDAVVKIGKRRHVLEHVFNRELKALQAVGIAK
jgi:hypothetical protein